MIDSERNVLIQSYPIEQKIVNVLDCVDNYEKLEQKLVSRNDNDANLDIISQIDGPN